MSLAKKSVSTLLKMATDNKGGAIPVIAELCVGVYLQPPRWVPHQDLVLADTFDQDEMPEAFDVQQHNHRQAHLLPETAQRHAKPIGPVSSSLKIVLHIKHGEPMLTYFLLICQREHFNEYIVLCYLIFVMKRQ